MNDREPARIARQLARRDQDAEADSFTLLLDPHHDHLTGASFAVTAAGVQIDATIYNDSLDRRLVGRGVAVGRHDGRLRLVRRDAHPVFAAAVSRGRSQLTFGINAMRYIQRKKEQAWLVHVPKTESGLASRMGHLEGLDGVVAAPDGGVPAVCGEPRRIHRAVVAGDPFNDGARAFAGTGVDLKYRMSSNLSLDGTINPDFGQVEVDPAVVNLTAFETFFEEKRPFFIEGREHLQQLRPRPARTTSGGSIAPSRCIFYSRRIGRSPQGSASGDFVEHADGDDDSWRGEADRQDAATAGAWGCSMR